MAAAKATTPKPQLVESLNRYARFMQANERVMRASDRMMDVATSNMEAVADAIEATSTYLAADGPTQSGEAAVN